MQGNALGSPQSQLWLRRWPIPFSGHENRPLRVTHAETYQRLVELWPRMGTARELLPGVVPGLLGPIDLESWIARR